MRTVSQRDFDRLIAATNSDLSKGNFYSFLPVMFIHFQAMQSLVQHSFRVFTSILQRRQSIHSLDLLIFYLIIMGIQSNAIIGSTIGIATAGVMQMKHLRASNTPRTSLGLASARDLFANTVVPLIRGLHRRIGKRKKESKLASDDSSPGNVEANPKPVRRHSPAVFCM